MFAVASILVLAQLDVPRQNHRSLEIYYQTLDPALRGVDGYGGLALWRMVGAPDRHLVIYEYRDIASADEGLQALAAGRLLTQTPVALRAPADVLRAEVLNRTGRALLSTPIERFLSLSIRVAEPGYGQELADELDNIFGELSFIPGFLGSLYARNETISEEVVGIVTWDTQESFVSSVPDGSPYEVRLYRRVV